MARRARPTPAAPVRSGATRFLHVGNIADTTSERQLGDLFGQFGDVDSIELVPRQGGALVSLLTIKAAVAARDQVRDARRPPARLRRLS